MGESVQDVDFLRLLHAELSTRGNDYDVWIGAHAKAELMTEEQIRVDLLTFGRK
jgi:hypothetical protein